MSVSKTSSDYVMHKICNHAAHASNNNKEGLGAFCERNFQARGEFFAATVVSPFVCTLDFAIGILLSVGSLLTLTLIKPLNKKAYNFSVDGGKIIPRTFSNFVSTLNPHADWWLQDYGIVHKYFKKVKEEANKFSSSESIVQRHVFSRLLFFTYALGSLVTRIVDFVIGIFAGLISLITLGTQPKVNEVALRGLSVFCIVSDLYQGLSGTINPWALV